MKSWNITTRIKPWNITSGLKPWKLLPVWKPWNITSVIKTLKYHYCNEILEISLLEWKPWNIIIAMKTLKYKCFQNQVKPHVLQAQHSTSWRQRHRMSCQQDAEKTQRKSIWMLQENTWKERYHRGPLRQEDSGAVQIQNRLCKWKHLNYQRKP